MEHSPSWEANRHSDGQEIPPPILEQVGSLQFSQEPATGSYPEPDESSPYLSAHLISLRFISTFHA
jgi:hypothetical protein